MSDETAVAVVDEAPAPLALPAIDDPVQLIALGIERGVPVETMERLLAMRQELDREAARKAFDVAMAAFQGECPTIKKTTPGAKTGGSVAYYYATMDAIVEQVGPLLHKHGFSYRFRCESPENGVAVTCEARHVDGHSECSRVAVPLGDRTGIMSAPQQTMAATTYAKRYAFLDVFGIATGDTDNDAAMPPQSEARAKPKPKPKPKPASATDDKADKADQKKAFALATNLWSRDTALWAVRWHCLLAGRDAGVASWSKSSPEVHALVAGHLAAVDAGEDSRVCRACEAAELYAKLAAEQGPVCAEMIAGATEISEKPVIAAMATMQEALDQGNAAATMKEALDQGDNDWGDDDPEKESTDGT